MITQLISIAGLKSLILSMMIFLSPIRRDYHENPTDRAARFEQVASDIAEVSLDQEEQSLFKGQFGRVHTALFLTSVAFNESGYRSDVDNGEKKGDNGRAFCLMQIHPNQPPFNFTPEYLADRKNCFRAGLRMIIAHNCSNDDLRQKMRSYLTGSCKTRENPKEEQAITRASMNEAYGYMRFRRHLEGVNFKYSELLQSEDEGKDASNNVIESRILAMAGVVKINNE